MGQYPPGKGTLVQDYSPLSRIDTLDSYEYVMHCQCEISCSLTSRVGLLHYVDHWAHNDYHILRTWFNLFTTYIFMVFIFKAILNHMPLKYRCVINMSTQIRHIYLSIHVTYVNRTTNLSSSSHSMNNIVLKLKPKTATDVKYSCLTKSLWRALLPCTYQ
jgi:hypothetical protein